MEARIPIRVLKKGAKAADAEASVLSGTAKCREKPIPPCGRERGHVGKIAARETGRLFVGNPWQAYVERSDAAQRVESHGWAAPQARQVRVSQNEDRPRSAS